MRNRLFTLRNAALAIFASLLMAGCMPSPYYQRAYSVPGNTFPPGADKTKRALSIPSQNFWYLQ